MISVICIYNDKEVLDEWLLKSIRDQTVKFELITIDNSRGRFKSASEALNYAGNKATGKYLVFVHQDIDLSSDKWLEDVEAVLDKIPNLGIAGVVGAAEGNKRILTNIRYGVPPASPCVTTIDRPARVQTLDECLVIVPKPVFQKLKFDSLICDDWHLYAVDYCLSVGQLGMDSVAIPFYVYHRSAGDSLSDKYYVSLTKVLKKHRAHCRKIYTTCGVWDTIYSIRLQKAYYLFKSLLKSLLTKTGAGYIRRKSGLESLRFLPYIESLSPFESNRWADPFDDDTKYGWVGEHQDAPYRR